MNFRIHPAVEEETQEAALWYESRRIGLGIEFLLEVDRVIQFVCNDPDIGTRLETLPDERDILRYQLQRFPYIVIYDISDGTNILSVTHTRRKPNSWLNRRG